MPKEESTGTDLDPLDPVFARRSNFIPGTMEQPVKKLFDRRNYIPDDTPTVDHLNFMQRKAKRKVEAMQERLDEATKRKRPDQIEQFTKQLASAKEECEEKLRYVDGIREMVRADMGEQENAEEEAERARVNEEENLKLEQKKGIKKLEDAQAAADAREAGTPAPPKKASPTPPTPKKKSARSKK